MQAFLDDAERYFQAAPGEETGWIQGLMAINNPRATKDCVDLIRDLAPGNTHYVYRGLNLADTHPFQEATLEIWAPEEDTSIYYGPFQPVAFGAAPEPTGRAKPILTPVEPPPRRGCRCVLQPRFPSAMGVWRQFTGNRQHAANNTSIVLYLSWRGWKLLFPGDAEERSWKEMDKRDLLQPVHFFKISHHGSITGMLPDKVVDKVLKLKKDDPTSRYAVLSAYPDLKKQKKGVQDWTYTDVPRQEVLDELKLRADLRQTAEVPDGGYIDYAFEGGTSTVTITRSK